MADSQYADSIASVDARSVGLADMAVFTHDQIGNQRPRMAVTDTINAPLDGANLSESDFSIHSSPSHTPFALQSDYGDPPILRRALSSATSPSAIANTTPAGLAHPSTHAPPFPVLPDAQPTSAVAILQQAWDIVCTVVPGQLTPSTPTQDRWPVFGLPHTVSDPPRHPRSNQHSQAVQEHCLHFAEGGEAHETGLLPLTPFKRTLNLLAPTHSGLELYRIRHSGIDTVRVPSKPCQFPLPVFREFQRRSSHMSDVANFIALLSAAQHTLLSSLPPTDEQQGQLSVLATALCVVSRDLTALSTAVELDFHRLRQRQALQSAPFDSALKSQLLALPIDNTSLFPKSAARATMEAYSTSTPALLSALARPRPHPYSRPSRGGPSSSHPRRRPPAATVTSQTMAPAPPPRPYQRPRGGQPSPRPFRRGSRSRRH